MLPSEVLDKAADLIAPEGAWTQGDYARDAKGAHVFDGSDGAVCWCASGAMWRASYGPRGEYTLFGEAREAAHVYLAGVCQSPDGITAWNDDPDRTQAEVVAKLREAAELARSEGQ